MNQDYTDIIQRLSQLLCQAMPSASYANAEREVNLSDGLEQLDFELAKLLRLVGVATCNYKWLDCAKTGNLYAKKTAKT